MLYRSRKYKLCVYKRVQTQQAPNSLTTTTTNTSLNPHGRNSHCILPVISQSLHKHSCRGKSIFKTLQAITFTAFPFHNPQAKLQDTGGSWPLQPTINTAWPTALPRPQITSKKSNPLIHSRVITATATWYLPLTAHNLEIPPHEWYYNSIINHTSFSTNNKSEEPHATLCKIIFGTGNPT